VEEAESPEAGNADSWSAKAIHDVPPIPFADANWGQSLLERGHPDAVKKGPHFADALEGWGEALMAKNQSHLALEKFKQAEKYAPHWGRLHLKWGEALTYAGKPAEAKGQFARAATLDLTSSEKSELAQQQHLGKTT
jgi:tetratricopeptide (TPR) repeat protein